MKKNNLKQIGFLALSLLTMNLINGAPVTPNTAATVAGAHAGEETMAAREAKAMQFFMKLLTCPVENVPAWGKFVEEITRLLEGNPKYAALCASLIRVKNDAGSFPGKLRIANELKQHESILPKEIVDTVKSLGMKLGARVKA